MAGNNVNSRQEKAATFYGKKIFDDFICVNDKVYAFLHADHPVFNVEIETCQGKINKILTRDHQNESRKPQSTNYYANSTNRTLKNLKIFVNYDDDCSNSRYEDNRNE